MVSIVDVFIPCSSELTFYPSVEILDFGYPQNSETGALKTFITQQGIKSQVIRGIWGTALLCWLIFSKSVQKSVVLITI